MRNTTTICDRCGATCDGVSILKAEVYHSGFNFQRLWALFPKSKEDSTWDLCFDCAASLESWKVAHAGENRGIVADLPPGAIGARVYGDGMPAEGEFFPIAPHAGEKGEGG